jgi:ABC-2 type transport system permease protein
MTARYDPQLNGNGGFFKRFWAMTVKEFIQMTRDRVTLATMIMIPVMQLLLFGFAINTTPHDLPTAVLMRENSDVGRSILAALKNTDFFEVQSVITRSEDMDSLLKSGRALFVVEIPEGFERAVRRGETPALLVAADATDPVASSSALGALSGIVTSALANDRQIEFSEPSKPAFSIVQHRRYNPAGSSTLNIVPGLLGTILTMTLLIFTALSVTREMERGTMENLLSMPIRPLEIMFGKITPYVLIGLIQALIIISAGILVFRVPILGDLPSLTVATALFVIANLSIGYTFSTLATNQLQAIQMAMMFFLPNILLSGFMFPFAGMPGWARWIGEALPLTHYIRIVRAIMLKGADIATLAYDTSVLAGLMALAMLIAVRRFRRTLD